MTMYGVVGRLVCNVRHTYVSIIYITIYIYKFYQQESMMSILYLNVSYLVLMHEDVQNRQLYVIYILPQCMMRLFLVPKSDAYNETTQ